MKQFIFLPAIVLLLSSCSGNSQDKLKVLGDLSLKEVSGLEYIKNSELWGLEDSGNKNKIYRFDETGNIIHEIKITDTKNNDWESVTADGEGNLYIGDFGNNKNDRKNLAIYKINNTDLGEANAAPSAVITFYYPEQTEFPPKKRQLIFDCESFLEYKGNFYLFTKNRSTGFDGTFQVYKVPNKAGNHAAKLLGTLKSCNIFNKCAITDADISPDGTMIVLLSGDKIWELTNFSENSFAKASMKMISLNGFSQKESVCFKDAKTLFIADEKDKNTGGKLYEFKLRN
jgi:hypothetical protein